MEPNVQSADTGTTKNQQSSLNSEPSGAISPVDPPSSDRPWQEWLEPVSEFLAKLPDYLGKFFSDYKQPLITVGLIVAGIITVKLTLALLSAINDVPLLAPVFELVGIGYTGWFVYRYLLQSKTRSELVQEFNSLKSEILGNSDAKQS
ncbi:CAAD domain-containing protein [Spirulina sp. CS-785/01]|uniref:CAAD domain-containing protein n=1 Tax=Spirulina sp. CS-785/01 TaxID=3021716 RepID=UPI00232E9947|nr:CAAD domain-containing protein [Spirulina sp. CS-785/01]MDB9315701.1 CAAD domain-containing protein [Spirulina sp. CS-785/01]